MRTDQLQLIVEIAECGSLTSAAKKLHLSQPNVSASIASLEEELNIRLFSRSRIGTQPTEKGQKVVEHAREILFRINEMKSIAKKDNSLVAGTLSIATIPSMCSTILPQTIGIFKNRFPQVRIDIMEEGTLQIQDHLLKNKVDLGLTSHRHASVQTPDPFYFKGLILSEMMACVPRQSPLAKKKRVSYAEIINYPLVLLNQEYVIHEHILNLLEKFGTPNVLLTARNPLSTKSLIAKGQAIGFDTELALTADQYIRSGEIVALNIEEETPRPFGILQTKKNLSIASKEFIKELKIQTLSYSKIYNLKMF